MHSTNRQHFSSRLLTWFSVLLCASGLLATSAGAAPALLLAEVYHAGIDPQDYLVSEKLDGVRAVWDGEVLRFRSGNPVAAPAWFLAGLPKTALDGELWGGRGSFERLSGIVRKAVPVDDEWRAVRYMIFELPDAPGDFRARAEAIRQLAAAANVPWLAAVAQTRGSDRAALQRQLAAIVAEGGEGLMLHRADAPYLTGRSDALLKLKPWEDAEARVLAHLPGQGKYRDRVGALLVETETGQRFRVGSGLSDALRTDPPPVGSLITYRYRARTKSGLPRFATYLRRRDDP